MGWPGDDLHSWTLDRKAVDQYRCFVWRLIYWLWYWTSTQRSISLDGLSLYWLSVRRYFGVYYRRSMLWLWLHQMFLRVCVMDYKSSIDKKVNRQSITDRYLLINERQPHTKYHQSTQFGGSSLGREKACITRRLKSIKVSLPIVSLGGK